MKFADIAGQEEIKQRLINSVKEHRISHAQLFHGAPGSGKLPMALAYAQFINCTNRSPDDSCGVCPSCIKYTKLAHPDLHFIFPVAKTSGVKKPSSNEFIGQWRTHLTERHAYIALEEWHQRLDIENRQGIINTEDIISINHTLSYKSFESEYKVMIIWMVERIFHAAAPRILKILEEPPEKTLFILITENPDLIPITILSRTQMIHFAPLPDDKLVEGLIRLKNISAAAAEKVKFSADGNLNSALQLVDSEDVFEHNFIFFRNWMRLCYVNNFASIHKLSADFVKLGREKQKSLLHYSLNVARYCLLMNYGLEANIRSEGEELEFIRKFSDFIHPGNIESISSAFDECIENIERNANGNILFINLSIEMAMWLKAAKVAVGK
ncbi:MAG: DNA polymerase III subunit delta [Lentimicrobiaceae bacterium]|jgi:DNA polymerase-3 subunit delta'|nr:DNA polymerase III subunit delta [Lentimicrobiaceae bacterium]MDY0026827.1 DNA polymerase III subunit delta [Lentimicrobium sp.]HAH59125.1 DNA polymerase III subunit delta [Bacteroidales bacterium]